ncbi:MAG TPA: Lpg1974 family pore-forming outer membrane protein, partial [Gemmataceae bacterium]|nr:Lpg1974 family pore-forming outer membrane protein [Gemmataceae bacterium]
GPLPPVVEPPPAIPALPVVNPPGWFAAIELDLVKPHIKNRLQATVPLDDLFNVRLHLPTAELAWTVAPRFEVGYRLPDELGELLVSYRFLVTEGCVRGSSADDLFFSRGSLKSRLDLQVIDLDYAHREYALGPSWDMKWKFGVRLANLFFDSRTAVRFTDLEVADDFTAGARTSNYFFGAGPHVGLDLWRRFGGTGLALFGRLEGALVVGRIHQAFEEVFRFDDLALGGATSLDQAQAVPVLNVQAGLGWTPAWQPGVRFAAGYQYEHWWYVGHIGDSRAELWDQGVFFRAEYKY